MLQQSVLGKLYICWTESAVFRFVQKLYRSCMGAVRGSGLRLNRLNLEGGELLVEGRIDAVEYAENGGRSRGFLGRLLG